MSSARSSLTDTPVGQVNQVNLPPFANQYTWLPCSGLPTGSSRCTNGQTMSPSPSALRVTKENALQALDEESLIAPTKPLPFKLPHVGTPTFLSLTFGPQRFNGTVRGFIATVPSQSSCTGRVSGASAPNCENGRSEPSNRRYHAPTSSNSTCALKSRPILSDSFTTTCPVRLLSHQWVCPPPSKAISSPT